MLIKEIRLQCFLTQKQFAQALGVSHSTVQKWEEGFSNPTPANKEKILEFYKNKKKL